jgi:hypothetical protein
MRNEVCTTFEFFLYYIIGVLGIGPHHYYFLEFDLHLKKWDQMQILVVISSIQYNPTFPVFPD